MLYSSRFLTNESAFFIEPKIVFGEIQPLLENNFSLFQIHRKKPYPLLNVNAGNRVFSRKVGMFQIASNVTISQVI